MRVPSSILRQRPAIAACGCCVYGSSRPAFGWPATNRCLRSPPDTGNAVRRNVLARHPLINSTDAHHFIWHAVMHMGTCRPSAVTSAVAKRLQATYCHACVPSGELVAASLLCRCRCGARIRSSDQRSCPAADPVHTASPAPRGPASHLVPPSHQGPHRQGTAAVVSG